MMPSDNENPIPNTTTLEGPAHELVARIYRELRDLAAGIMRRLPAGSATLQPTALVHEAYLRLSKDPDRRWKGRRHFYHAAAMAMRHLLIERARARGAERHGGAWQRTDISVTLSDPERNQVLTQEELMDLDRALDKMQQDYPDLVEIVLMRYFCGMTVPEIAGILETSTRSIERKWHFARGWLFTELAR